MASILKVDEMQGVTSAGDITITGEGGAATMQLQQGVAKAWINFNGTGTIASRDTHNVSSLTDNTTGEYTFGLSNAMSNSNYAFYGSGSKASGAVSSSNSAILYLKESPNYTTTAVAIGVCDSTGSSKDVDTVVTSVNGDLA